MLWLHMLRAPLFGATRKRRDNGLGSAACLLLLWTLLVTHVRAVFVTYDNCLPSSITGSSDPKQLQFVPLYLDAAFNTTNTLHALNLTFYGNVTGQDTAGTYPSPYSSSWTNASDTFGKIINISPSTNTYTTLYQRYQFLSYNAAGTQVSPFCESVINGSCPLAPSFFVNASIPYELSTFSVQQDLNTSYAFATVVATITVKSGDADAADIACISVNITPDLGPKLSGLIRYLPVVVLFFVGVAVMAAGIFSPWGTSDPFKWTTNYGRDQDLLRLVTPGFGDCLQYIQFVFLTGALTLSYPGYYQPATSRLDWSSLLFNESFVTHGAGYSALQDGIYAVNGTYGLTVMSQLMGMTLRTDMWACMAVWLALLCFTAFVFCQLAFFLRWVYFKWTDTSQEDLRHKNWPLTCGMLVRVVYNYFLLPIVAISAFQLLIAPSSRFYTVIAAVVVLFAILLLAAWMIMVLIRTKPRAQLFDDLPTLLIYGSLYNTYNDQRALFSIIPVALTVIRGVAIGACQPSGIAQIILLAICEVVFVLVVHAFRPFSSPTHMNLMHTIFAMVRLVTVLLMVSFAPSLGVSESSKGWIGYIILILHAMVLLFGFFLNAVQTLIEVGARMAGAGGDQQHGAHRGALISYSFRQLRRRDPKKDPGRPGSMASNAAMLVADSDNKSLPSGRTRSLSASSRLLLASGRMSVLSSFPDDQSTPGIDSPPGGTFPPSAGARASQATVDPYYRPPRTRRTFSEAGLLGAASTTRPTASSSGGEWGDRGYDDGLGSPIEPVEGPLGQDNTASPGFYRQPRTGSEVDLTEAQPRPDYAVREVDFYYGVTRGPALSSMPSRKRKTGPADPMGPVSNASSWLNRLIGGKKKDKQKGFEVVRSSRAPAEMRTPLDTPLEEGEEMQTSPPIHYPRYTDGPDASPPQARPGAIAPGVPAVERTKRRMPVDGSWGSDDSDSDDDPYKPTGHKSPASPPTLQPILRSPTLRMPFADPDAIGVAVGGSPPLSPVSDATAGSTSPSVPRRSSMRGGSRDLGSTFSPEFGRPFAAFPEGNRPSPMGSVNSRLAGRSVVDGPRRAEGVDVEIVRGASP